MIAQAHFPLLRQGFPTLFYRAQLLQPGEQGLPLLRGGFSLLFPGRSALPQALPLPIQRLGLPQRYFRRGLPPALLPEQLLQPRLLQRFPAAAVRQQLPRRGQDRILPALEPGRQRFPALILLRSGLLRLFQTLSGPVHPILIGDVLPAGSKSPLLFDRDAAAADRAAGLPLFGDLLPELGCHDPRLTRQKSPVKSVVLLLGVQGVFRKMGEFFLLQPQLPRLRAEPVAVPLQGQKRIFPLLALLPGSLSLQHQRLRPVQLLQPLPELIQSVLRLGKAQGSFRLPGPGLFFLSQELIQLFSRLLQLPQLPELILRPLQQEFQFPQPCLFFLVRLSGLPGQGQVLFPLLGLQALQPQLLPALAHGPVRPVPGLQEGPHPVIGRLRPLQTRPAKAHFLSATLQAVPFPFQPLQIRKAGVQLQGSALLPVQFADALPQALLQGGEGVQLSLFLLRQRPQILQQRGMAGQEALRLSRLQLIRGQEHIPHEVAQFLLPFAAASAKLVPGPAQQVLVTEVLAVIEELAQDLVFLVAVRLQKLPELPLGQHHDLPELLRVQTQQFLNPSGHLVRALGGFPVRLLQQRADLLVAVAALGPPLAGKVDTAVDGVLLAALLKAQLHHRVRALFHIVAVEHGGAPVPAAGPAVEGENHRVEDGGLAGAGVPRHQVEPSVQRGKGDRGLPGIGAEGRHFQFQRSHRSASCSVRKSSRAAMSCCSLMPLLSRWRSRSPAKRSRARSSPVGSSPPQRSV